jgi:hypothetical protein
VRVAPPRPFLLASVHREDAKDAKGGAMKSGSEPMPFRCPVRNYGRAARALSTSIPRSAADESAGFTDSTVQRWFS